MQEHGTLRSSRSRYPSSSGQGGIAVWCPCCWPVFSPVHVVNTPVLRTMFRFVRRTPSKSRDFARAWNATEQQRRNPPHTRNATMIQFVRRTPSKSRDCRTFNLSEGHRASQETVPEHGTLRAAAQKSTIHTKRYWAAAHRNTPTQDHRTERQRSSRTFILSEGHRARQENVQEHGTLITAARR